MKRTVRLEQIEQILLDHPDGMRVIEISERCDVDRRTIYRDLQLMKKMGLPIWRKHGRFGIEREQYFTHMRINLNEAFTLLWALRLLSYHAELENPHATSLFKKITAALPPKLARQLDSIRAINRSKKHDRRHLQMIENLIRAWADNLKLSIVYQGQTGRSKPAPRVVAPLMLDTSVRGKLFMIGLDELNRDIRIFNVEHISRADVLEDEPFRRPGSMDFTHYITAGQDIPVSYAHTVVLRFLPEAAAKVVDGLRNPGQRVELYPDGSCIFIAEVMDWHEMENWVRSWGAQVEVIAPADFREAIASEFKQGAKLYG